MTHRNRLSLVSLMALGIAMPAIAQEAPAQTAPAAAAGPQQATPPAEDRLSRDVVVVTAQKREESVQDIAIAVTAITSDLRDEIGLNSVQDYTNFAPGLTYSTSNDRLGMRGVTRTSNNFGIRSGISNYVDGVYFSSAIPAGRAPLFVDRVEVVRGPQGTLYGRDSIGGALNLISKRPTEEFEGQFNMSAGNYEQRTVEGTMAGPITDWLRYRVGGSRIYQGEGYLENRATGETEYGNNDEYYLEAQLEGQIGDRFDWWTRYGRLAWHREGAPGARVSAGSQQPYTNIFYNSTADLGPNGFAGLLDPNRVQVGSQTTNPTITDRYAFNADFKAFAHLQPTQEIALEGIYHFDNFDLKYLGGYVYYNYDLQQDQDNSPVKSFTNYRNRGVISERQSDYTENRGWFSNEINFLSTWEGPLQMVAGLYQYQENYTQTVFTSTMGDPGGPIWDVGATQAWLTNAGPFVPAVPRPANLPILPNMTGQTSASGSPWANSSLAFHTNNQAVNNAYGAFVQGDYAFNDQWKLTAGVRYSKDVMEGREYARFISHYNLEDTLETGFIQAYSLLPAYAGLRASLGPGAAAIINAATNAGVPARIDATSTLGGPDPSTVTAANPCGFAGKGIVNLNVTAANSTAAGCAADKSRYGIYYDPLTGNRYRDLAATWNEVTGVLGLDWTPDTDTLIYGKYNRGYKPGGLGAADVFGTLLATPYTDKELMNAYELGLKRDWRDWNLTTNIVAFLYDYEGYQVPNTIVPPDNGGAVRPQPYTAYVNLPKVETTGIEFETMWYPTDNLRFFFNYGYTNPEIGDSPSLVHSLDPFALDPAAQPLGAAAATPATCPAPPFSPAGSAPTTCRGVQGQNLKGNLLPFSPKNKIALNGTYTWRLEGGSEFDASLSYFWQDISYTSIFNRSYTKTPSWDQTDARLSWTNSDGNITLIGYVKNLFDDIAYDSRTAGLREGGNNQVAPTLCNSTAGTTNTGGTRAAQSCYTTAETLRPPRTYGAELQFKF
jgi:iron complex outermembrane receptor protein